MKKSNNPMGRFQYFHIANDVLVGNLIAVLIGDWLTDILFQHRARDASESMLSLLRDVDMVFGLVAGLAIILVTLAYERPIRTCLKCFRDGSPCDPKILEIAGKRVLNEPYMIVVLDLAAWGTGAMIFWAIGSPGGPGIAIACGLITLMLAFFWVEHVIQHNLVPLFFPHGVLSTIRGVKSISLRGRFFALIFAVSVVPLAFIHLTIHWFREKQIMGEITPLMLVSRIQEAIAVESILFMVVGIVLSYLVMSNLRRPVKEIVRVMGEVKKGNFNISARVVTNDELGFAGETLNAMTAGLREREMIKDTFGRYVDRRIRDEILRGKIPLDGEVKEATILFADLRNFTPLVAVTPPKELIYKLNAYFNEMEAAVKAHNGLILQFIGDEVEAVFGAPIPAPFHELAALETALDMRVRLERLNKKFEDRGTRPIAHGVGIHTGPVLAANIGSTQRSAYSLIGDTVNLASRIQGLTKEFKTDILVSSAVREALESRYAFRAMPDVRVKGKPDPIRVYVPDGARFSIEDITKEKKIREALKRSENNYRELFEKAPMMYVIIENQKELPIITDCNHRFLSALGYSRENVIGKSLSEFYTGDSKEKLTSERNFRRMAESSFEASERKLIRYNGDIIHTMLKAEPAYDEMGKVTGARCMYIDITSQKRAEEQLKESRELLLMIVDGISDPLIMVNRHMDLVMMNVAAEKYFQMGNEHCLGRKCHEIFEVCPDPCDGCRVQTAMNTGRKESYERNGLRDPENLEDVSVYPVMEKGRQIWAAIVRISDVTKARQMEKELIHADKMISLGVLVSGMAHEINNPNNFILSNVTVLQDAWNGIIPVIEKYYAEKGDFSIAGLPYNRMREEVPLLFSGIKKGASRINRIVQDLKNFSRQHDTRMDQIVNIKQMVKDAIRFTGNLIKEKTDHFRFEDHEHLPNIKGNAQMLEQVMINLIQNACQSLPDKEKGIFITPSLDKKTESIVIEVRDEGVGIPEKLLPRIMDPFFTTRRDQGGTGLGLAVSLSIVKAHHGQLKVTSETGKGSVFKVAIPIAPFQAPLILSEGTKDNTHRAGE